MQNKCDILILTANFGNGHTSVSKAIESYIKDRDSSVNIQIVDMYKIIRPRLYKGIYGFYSLLIKYAISIYNYDYYKKNNNDKFGELHACFKSSSRRLARYLEEVQPSLIISTFPTCSAYITKHKKENKVDIPLITCITDIVKGSEWVHDGNNMYLVATESVKSSLVEKGIEKECIINTGIPIRSEFLEKKDKLLLRKEYDLLEDDFVILMMGGGMGLIPREETFYNWISTHKNIKLFIITGHNKDLYQKISKFGDNSNITILQYTDRVADMMTMSDLLITKPGGITIFETISRSLPFIIYKPVLGQELENCRYIKEKELGYIVSNEDELKDKIRLIMKDDSLRYKIVKNLMLEKKNINMESLAENIMSVYDQYSESKVIL